MSRPSSSSPAELSQQPVTRSRTLFYLSIRDSITPTHNRGRIKTGQYGDTLDIADNEEEERLIEGTGRGKGLPPKWCAFDIVNRRIGELLIRRVDISDEVEEILGRVGNKGKLMLSRSGLELIR
jgi:syntaxin 16